MRGVRGKKLLRGESSEIPERQGMRAVQTSGRIFRSERQHSEEGKTLTAKRVRPRQLRKKTSQGASEGKVEKVLIRRQQPYSPLRGHRSPFPARNCLEERLERNARQLKYSPPMFQHRAQKVRDDDPPAFSLPTKMAAQSPQNRLLSPHSRHPSGAPGEHGLRGVPSRGGSREGRRARGESAAAPKT